MKKVLFPLFSLFLIFQSCEILRLILVAPSSEYSLPIKILMAALVNLFVTGIFAFVGFAYKTSALLPEAYFEIKDPVRLTKFSKFLKMDYFKKFLLFVFWGSKRNRKKFFDGTRRGIENFEFQTRQSEFGHLLSFVTIVLISFIMLIRQHIELMFLTSIVNIVFNLYPVILQRTHRVQIDRIRNLTNKTDRISTKVSLNTPRQQ